MTRMFTSNCSESDRTDVHITGLSTGRGSTRGSLFKTHFPRLPFLQFPQPTQLFSQALSVLALYGSAPRPVRVPLLPDGRSESADPEIKLGRAQIRGAIHPCAPSGTPSPTDSDSSRRPFWCSFGASHQCFPNRSSRKRNCELARWNTRSRFSFTPSRCPPDAKASRNRHPGRSSPSKAFVFRKVGHWPRLTDGGDNKILIDDV
ncbi:hypothetical protein DFJ73DRAFT_128332 [Zopfochytrium polystomum]|nr:hypothetical protein DFJ73DRAFT_128332 [Zopfochytrium polystomum]